MNAPGHELTASEDAMSILNRSGRTATEGRRRPSAALCAVMLTVLALALGGTASGSSVATDEETFASPDQAAAALAAAWRDGSAAASLKIFGRDGMLLVRSGDQIADLGARRQMAADYDVKHQIEPEGPRKAMLVLGTGAWPYPIPLVKVGDAWRFDVEAGAQQIIDRRVGRNEMQAIATARAYVQAQRDYAARLAKAGERPQFARKIGSTAGAHDGLYWPASKSEESPLGPLVAAAEANGYGPPADTDHQPFHGYLFRVLIAQGPHAPGGARSYLEDGRLTRGFALIAHPVRYGDSGIMTFIVNQHGIVFEKDLGPDTAKVAAGVTTYDPDMGWRVAKP